MLLLLRCCLANMQMPRARLAVGRSGQYMFAAASVAALRVENVTIELCRCVLFKQLGCPLVNPVNGV
jgi:hypothetical protein